MSTDQISFFDLASKRMTWSTARQGVVARNVANADTPGARARDVEPFEAYLARATQTAREAPGAPAPHSETVRETWSTSPSGNGISLAEQTLAANEASGQHRLAADLYKKMNQLLIKAASAR